MHRQTMLPVGACDRSLRGKSSPGYLCPWLHISLHVLPPQFNAFRAEGSQDMASERQGPKTLRAQLECGCEAGPLGAIACACSCG